MGLVQIGVRVDTSVKDQIKQLVDAGEYRDITDFAAKAIQEKLKREIVPEHEKLKQTLLDRIRCSSNITIDLNESDFTITGKFVSKEPTPPNDP